MSRVGWLDLSSGVSGDMLLGALAGAGVDVAVFQAAVDPLGLPIRFRVEPVRRAGVSATRVHVGVGDGTAGEHRRTWADVQLLLDRVARPLPAVAGTARQVFALLAEAEADVHGIPVADVHFHEVGALDALADVLGVVAGFVHLALDRLTTGPLALGGGTVQAAHGRIPVPGPAVLEILRRVGLPAAGGPELVELCTPTGAALVASLADGAGPMPAMRLSAVGSGAGARELAGAPNVARLVVGSTADDRDSPDPVPEPARLIEANVDDLDPRLWPEVLDTLFAVGAADAWLVPILMKKGRPAHTLCVLVDPDLLSAVREVIYRHTSTIGVRETAVTKRPLPRALRTVDIDGRTVVVKCAFLPDGRLVTAQPEWDDVAAAATALGLPAREVLARAQALARGI